LRSGEKRLANGVAAGTIPLKVAITLAAAPEGAVQNILADAYERGEIRGAKLLTVQKILSDRATKTGEVPSAGTTQDLAREYERHTAKQRALVRRASLVHERLVALGAAFERLLSDQTFVALLRAERLESVPALFTAAWGHNAKR
jgi:ParB family chromosome partitioning protein